MRPGDHRQYLLAELRAASLRARLMASEIDAVGVALSTGLCNEYEAVAWLREFGGDSLIGRGLCRAVAEEGLPDVSHDDAAWSDDV